jgi:hypothetical protein
VTRPHTPNPAGPSVQIRPTTSTATKTSAPMLGSCVCPPPQTLGIPECSRMLCIPWYAWDAGTPETGNTRVPLPGHRVHPVSGYSVGECLGSTVCTSSSPLDEEYPGSVASCFGQVLWLGALLGLVAPSFIILQVWETSAGEFVPVVEVEVKMRRTSQASEPAQTPTGNPQHHLGVVSLSAVPCPAVSKDAFYLFLVPPPPGVRGRVRAIILLRKLMILGRCWPGSGG